MAIHEMEFFIMGSTEWICLLEIQVYEACKMLLGEAQLIFFKLEHALGLKEAQYLGDTGYNHCSFLILLHL